MGWFGFNAGSAAGANALAGVAMLQHAGRKLPVLLLRGCLWNGLFPASKCARYYSGAVAGLVAVTPAAGFVNPTGALIIGVVAGAVCYVAAVKIKHAAGL
ncbi:hypothetical protein ACQT3V_08370 [Brucella sp. NF 2653]|uniref:hypothetical protein n=1 Tax=Brucella sp. NF 2653 TaxID=693748 RepID=UPI003D145592